MLLSKAVECKLSSLLPMELCIRILPQIPACILSHRIAFCPQTEISILKEEMVGITARKTVAHLVSTEPLPAEYLFPLVLKTNHKVPVFWLSIRPSPLHLPACPLKNAHIHAAANPVTLTEQQSSS